MKTIDRVSETFIGRNVENRRYIESVYITERLRYYKSIIGRVDGTLKKLN